MNFNDMKQADIDEKYMRRCLQLAYNGMLKAKPNPMVGAVIVSKEGRIIGEGYHVQCGKGHAEVNAFASVKEVDSHLLHDATLYVSLEPCSHYGKTPPCADLIIRKGVHRVVCGCIDPFAEVHGRGVQKLRDAGIEVTVGVLEKECLELNKRFITYNTHHRPYVILKWAQTMGNPAYIGYLPSKDYHPLNISTPFTKMLVHKLRAENDAILVGRTTDDLEHPQLTVREWSGKNPEKIVLSQQQSTSSAQYPSPQSVLEHLYQEKKQSLIVEGGASTLQSFLDAGLWDEIRVETGSLLVDKGVKAPQMPSNIRITRIEQWDGNKIVTYHREER